MALYDAMRRVFVVMIALLVNIGAALPAAAAVRFVRINFNPPGADTHSKDSLRQEYVLITNNGNKVKQLKGWKLRDSDGDAVYRFPDFKLRPGRDVRVRTGPGQDDGNDLYMDKLTYVWDNTGDKATLKRPGGTVADTCSYSGNVSPAPC